MTVIQKRRAEAQWTPMPPWRLADNLPRAAKNAIFCNLTVALNDASLRHCGLDFDYLYRDYVDKALTGGCQPVGTVALGISGEVGSPQDLAIIALERAARAQYIPVEPKVYVSHGTGDSGIQSHASLLQAFLAAEDPYEAVPALAVVPYLSHLTGLPRGWDGYEAEPIDDAVVNRALEVLSTLSAMAVLNGLILPRPDVGPTPAGSILFEWDLPAAYFSVDCNSAPETLCAYVEHIGDGSEEELTADSVEDFWPLVSQLLPKDNSTRAFVRVLRPTG